MGPTSEIKCKNQENVITGKKRKKEEEKESVTE
jgi:hypothetical protein